MDPDSGHDRPADDRSAYRRGDSLPVRRAIGDLVAGLLRSNHANPDLGLSGEVRTRLTPNLPVSYPNLVQFDSLPRDLKVARLLRNLTIIVTAQVEQSRNGYIYGYFPYIYCCTSR